METINNVRNLSKIKDKDTKIQLTAIDIVLVFLLLTSFVILFSSVSIVDFEQVNVSWDVSI